MNPCLTAFLTSCSECPAGTYSDSVSNSPCQSCPDNSEATQTGLSECPCVQNYYRASDEGAGEPCTRELWTVYMWTTTTLEKTSIFLYFMILYEGNC